MSYTTAWKLSIEVYDSVRDKYKINRYYYHTEEELKLSQKYIDAKESYVYCNYKKVYIELYNNGKFKRVDLLEFQLS
jgi:hypothetical protein